MKITPEELETVPALTACNPGVRPYEFKVVVAMAKPPEKTKGGLYIPDSAKERNEMAAQLGRLVAVSPMAFTYDARALEHAPKVGDVVTIGKFGGSEFTGPDGQFYRILEDRNVSGVVDVLKVQRSAEKQARQQAA